MSRARKFLESQPELVEICRKASREQVKAHELKKRAEAARKENEERKLHPAK